MNIYCKLKSCSNNTVDEYKMEIYLFKIIKNNVYL